ncbi:MAG TPA: YbhB/YbcL family Raf kinase inhibitor-like protein [Acidimicrobiia bacterium]|nr:YbhB/YbcL family Raf kinase inhibitor-like protein [Acidimicrobiia bacterium]
MRRVAAMLATLAVASTVVASVAAPAAARGARIRLTSPAFSPGGMIPIGFTCDDHDVPPPLRWSGLPASSVELAVTLEDLDGPGGRFVHWVAWGIDPVSRGLPEGVVPAGVHEGRNSAGRAGYLGPCPPAGSDPHRYRFTLYALRRHLVLGPDATLTELRAAMRDAIVGRAELVGRYAR